MLHASALRITGLTALAAAAALALAAVGSPAGAGEEGDPGVHDDRIVFGQSAALSGPARQLGRDMRLGNPGRVSRSERGRRRPRPEAAAHHVERFLRAQAGVLQHPASAAGGQGLRPHRRGRHADLPRGGAGGAGRRGAVPGPLHRRGVSPRPEAGQGGEPAGVLLSGNRGDGDPPHRGPLGVTRIAVFYQNDSFGEAGLEGVRRALKRRNMSPVAAWSYERNTTGVKRALLGMIESEPEAVIMVGAYAPVAELVVLARRKVDPVFMSVSFVGSEALLAELGVDGAGLYITQVVPAPHDNGIPRGRRLSRGAGRIRPRRLAGVRFAGGISGRTARRGRSGGLRPARCPAPASWTPFVPPAPSISTVSGSTTVPVTIRVRMRCS